VSDTLRIALVAPPWYPVPPRGYGGTERVVHLLRLELQRRGHDVTTFGAEGSAPGVEVLAPAAWSGDLGNPDHHTEWNRHFTYLARLFERLKSDSFDVVHDHTRSPGVLVCLAANAAPVVVHTMHEPLRESAVQFLGEVRDRICLIALSHAHAETAAPLTVDAVVYNAVDPTELRPRAENDGYLLQIGRIAPAKGQHLAIEVACRTGRRLVLAGKVSTAEDPRYFDEQIRPHLGNSIVHLEDVGGAEKVELVARAHAGVFPHQWPEPFGLSIVECMASGVPAVALARGAAAELVEDGTTGFLADDVDGLVDAIERVGSIDRAQCARIAAQRFSPAAMVDAYLSVYAAGFAKRSLARPTC
jgi:glycosyltransferase involved in cell wall biosynthesis